MKVVKLSLIALAVAAGSQFAVAGDQQESKGFIEDSTLKLINRNLYMQRNFVNSQRNTREEWAHGMHLNYASGFTQGTVGHAGDHDGGFDDQGLLGKASSQDGLRLAVLTVGVDGKT